MRSWFAATVDHAAVVVVVAIMVVVMVVVMVVIMVVALPGTHHP